MARIFGPPDLTRTANPIIRDVYHACQQPSGCRIIYSIDHNRLVVDSSSQTCGHKRCQLNYEEMQKHSVTIRVTDTGSPPMSTDFLLEIEVADANDEPYDIRLTSKTVFENEEPGTEIGKIRVRNPHSGENLH